MVSIASHGSVDDNVDGSVSRQHHVPQTFNEVPKGGMKFDFAANSVLGIETVGDKEKY